MGVEVWVGVKLMVGVKVGVGVAVGIVVRVGIGVEVSARTVVDEATGWLTVGAARVGEGAALQPPAMTAKMKPDKHRLPILRV